MGLATPADRDALYAYCEAVVLHREACRPSTWKSGGQQQPRRSVYEDSHGLMIV
jgi:hypothetical protein